MPIHPVARLRLLNQQVLRPRFRQPAELVRWLGAVQAQDYLGSVWAIGLRLAGASESDVEDAIAARAIVRTWPMRGTLHFVAAEDVRWMLPLLTPRVIVRAAGRYRELGLDDVAFRRSRQALARALEGGRRLTRSEAYAVIERGGVSTQGQRGIHILSHLAQLGIVCFGPRQGRQPTFVLLEEWVPARGTLPRDQALATLAERYFASHGPATLPDFAWWSGLLVTDAQAAIDRAGAQLVSQVRDGRAWWACAGEPAGRLPSPSAALLPPWDEYLVAYKDRASALDERAGPAHPVMPIGRSLVVLDGRVRGAWRRTLSASGVRVSLDFWGTATPAERRAAEQAAARYRRFLGRA